MDINTNYSAPNSGAEPQSQDGQKKGLGNLKLNSKMIAIIAVVVLVILVYAIFTGIPEGKAKKAVKTYVQVFVSGDKRDNEVKWKKFYPKEFEREIEDWAEKTADTNFEDVEKYKVLNVTKISGKDVDKILEKWVESFFEEEVSSRSGKEIENRDLRDLKISSAYLVTTKFEYDGDVRVIDWVVIKVNGRYGVYDSRFILGEY